MRRIFFEITAFPNRFDELHAKGMGPVAAGGVSRRRSSVASGMSTTSLLSGMEQQGLVGGHVMMDERRMVALSGVVVAPTAARPGKVDSTVQH